MDFPCLRVLQNNKALKQQPKELKISSSLRVLQNNKALKLPANRILSISGLRVLQNNKALKPQIRLKNTTLPRGYFVFIYIF